MSSYHLERLDALIRQLRGIAAAVQLLAEGMSRTEGVEYTAHVRGLCLVMLSFLKENGYGDQCTALHKALRPFMAFTDGKTEIAMPWLREEPESIQ